MGVVLAVIFLGLFGGPGLKVLVHSLITLFTVLKWVYLITWWLMKQIWGFLNNGCRRSAQMMEDDDELYDKMNHTDESVRAFKRARNIISRGMQADQAQREADIQKAMEVLWKQAPKDVAIHGCQNEENFRKFQERLQCGKGAIWPSRGSHGRRCSQGTQLKQDECNAR